MRLLKDPFDPIPDSAVKSIKRKKHKRSSHDRRQAQMMQEMGAQQPLYAPPVAPLVDMAPAKPSMVARMKDKMKNMVLQHKKRTAVVVLALVSFGIAFTLVKTGAFTNDHSAAADGNGKSKPKKKRGKNQEKRVEFEEEHQAMVETEERQKHALKQKFQDVTGQIRALEQRSQENMAEAHENSDNYKRKYSQPKGGGYPDGANTQVGSSFGQGFSTPEEAKRSKTGMMLLSQELSQELTDITEEHGILVTLAQKIEREFTERWPE
jgi:hypothetical protein